MMNRVFNDIFNADKFLDKAQCIIWQYGNYTAESVNKKLNGVNTQGENIADNGGGIELRLGRQGK